VPGTRMVKSRVRRAGILHLLYPDKPEARRDLEPPRHQDTKFLIFPLFVPLCPFVPQGMLRGEFSCSEWGFIRVVAE